MHDIALLLINVYNLSSLRYYCLGHGVTVSSMHLTACAFNRINFYITTRWTQFIAITILAAMNGHIDVIQSLLYIYNTEQL